MLGKSAAAVLFVATTTKLVGRNFCLARFGIGAGAHSTMMAYKKMPVEMRAVKVIQNGVLAGVHVGGRAGQVVLKVW